MKRKVIASKASEYTDYMKYTRSRQNFGIHYAIKEDEFNGKYIICQIREIHPYDDAEYAWAKFDGQNAIYIKNGKQVLFYDMQEYYYEGDGDDVYESFEEYMNDVIDTICVQLLRLNEDVEPRMVHN